MRQFYDLFLRRKPSLLSHVYPDDELVSNFGQECCDGRRRQFGTIQYDKGQQRQGCETDTDFSGGCGVLIPPLSFYVSRLIRIRGIQRSSRHCSILDTRRDIDGIEEKVMLM